MQDRKILEIHKNIIHTVKGKVYNVHKHESTGKKAVCKGIGRTKPAVDGRCPAQFVYRFSSYWDHFDNGNSLRMEISALFRLSRTLCVLFALY